MRYKDCLNESEQLLLYRDTSWDILHHIEEWVVTEVCDQPIDISINNHSFYNFETKFNIGVDQYYIFKALSIKNGIYEIMFYPDNNDITYGNIKGKKWVGGVCSGVLLSLEKLINTHNVESFIFKTHDNDLKRLYTTILPIIIKRFPSYTNKKPYNDGKWLKFEFRL